MAKISLLVLLFCTFFPELHCKKCGVESTPFCAHTKGVMQPGSVLCTLKVCYNHFLKCEVYIFNNTF
jgi:hypothetical protein